jgi:hypothetical protein
VLSAGLSNGRSAVVSQLANTVSDVNLQITLTALALKAQEKQPK